MVKQSWLRSHVSLSLKAAGYGHCRINGGVDGDQGGVSGCLYHYPLRAAMPVLALESPSLGVGKEELRVSRVTFRSVSDPTDTESRLNSEKDLNIPGGDGMMGLGEGCSLKSTKKLWSLIVPSLSYPRGGASGSICLGVSIRASLWYLGRGYPSNFASR